MSHRYPTRFQIKFQKEQAEVLQSVLYVKDILHRMGRDADFCEKAADAILLFEHLYEVPLLLESYEKFRQTVWDKMNELEATILRKLQAMPAKSAQHGAAATTEYEMRARLLSFNLLHLMESVRVAFW
jgi:hypothetical protein